MCNSTLHHVFKGSSDSRISVIIDKHLMSDRTTSGPTSTRVIADTEVQNQNQNQIMRSRQIGKTNAN